MSDYIPSPTTVETMTPPTVRKRLREVLDNRKIPYILCQVRTKNGKKDIRAIPNGWTNWTYEQCVNYNSYRADPKCSIMNINLRAGGLVVVDIDGGEVELLTKNYSPYGLNITRSISRGLPHIWFDRMPDDEWTTAVKIKGEEVDYLYQNVFENVDSEIENYDETGFDEFDWLVFRGKPEKKEKKKRTFKKSSAKEDGEGEKYDDVTHPLLDMIDMKYLDNYDDWLKIIWAIKTEFTKYKEVAIFYSRKARPEVSAEEVCEKLDECSTIGNLTMGTIRHYAKLSNPEAYHEYCAPKIKLDDESLAEYFMFLFGNDNIKKDKNGKIFIYKQNKRLWEPQDRETTGYLRYEISKQCQKTVDKKIDILEDKMGEHDVMSAEYEKLEKAHTTFTDIKKYLRSTRGTSAIYNKVADILTSLEKEDILFDIGANNHYNIQFRNGVFDMNSMNFREREKKDYITKTLDWDFCHQHDEDNINIVNEFFRKVCGNEELRKFQIAWLAFCLTGDMSRELFKMNIGSGSNGKTMEFSIFHKCFPLYTHKVDNKTFTEGYSDRHKQLFRLTEDPIRMLYMEEMPTTRMDVDALKDIITGRNIAFKITYVKDILTIDTQAKLNTCSNNDPNGKCDKGILRRGLQQNYDAEFRDDATDDYEKRIFKKQDGFDLQFDDPKMKLAFFHVLMGHYNRYMIVPKQLRDNFKDLMEDNDNFRNDFDMFYEITDDEDDRVSKTEILMTFQNYNKNYRWSYLLQQLKRLGVVYDRNKRVNGVKGCFVGIKKIHTCDVPTHDEEDEDPDY